MSTTQASIIPAVFPFLCYHDAATAIEWLAAAFGFRAGEITTGPDGRIVHVELSLGRGIIMIASASGDDFHVKTPNASSAVDRGIYVTVPDPDGHYERAAAAGAEIVIALHDTNYGSREYLARDPEGNLWSFGTYVPEVPQL